MTVKELKNALSEYDDEMEVMVFADSDASARQILSHFPYFPDEDVEDVEEVEDYAGYDDDDYEDEEDDEDYSLEDCYGNEITTNTVLLQIEQ